MTSRSKYLVPRVVVVAIAIALFGAQWLVGEFPVWFFAAPINFVFGALLIVVLWEGYRRREKFALVRYLLTPEATYIALAVAALISVVLGLQIDPATASWPVVGGAIYIQTVLTLVILRGWRNSEGVRWRFLATHCGLWLVVASMLLGAPDKQVLRAQVGSEPTREVVSELGEKSYLDYELRLDKFEMERSEDGTPQMFRASVEVDGKVVDIEVNSPYSQGYGEDIYLVSYEANSSILQIVREPWRAVTVVGIALLLIGAFMLFMKGFGGAKQ